jgi:hypothetical protein
MVVQALSKALSDAFAFGEAISHVISEFHQLFKVLVVGLYQPLADSTHIGVPDQICLLQLYQKTNQITHQVIWFGY